MSPQRGLNVDGARERSDRKMYNYFPVAKEATATDRAGRGLADRRTYTLVIMKTG
jgi:hypothetical protein